MRLEIDATVSAPPVTDAAGLDKSVDQAEARSSLNQGIKAAQAGDRSHARKHLLRATELDPRNESAWLWLASISEYPEELLGFLNHVLEINPENERASEWKVATHALLSKTFVQRGIDAAQENHKDFAAECFQTALEYDDRNALAWMWMASLADSNAAKVDLLERALAIEPENASAASALEAAKSSILKDRLTEAKAAAVAGRNAEAIAILDSLLEIKPDSVEAWTMRSHLSEGFDEKIRCFESILAIEPDNVAAKAGRDSLLSIFGTAEAANVESSREVHHAVDEATLAYSEVVAEPTCDRSPIEDLETPEGWSDAVVPVYHAEAQHTPENQNENQESENIAEPFATFAEETPEHTETAASDTEQPIETEAAVEAFVLPMDEPSEDAVSYADPQAETVAFRYEPNEGTAEGAVESQWSADDSDSAIGMPSEALPTSESESESDPYATVVEPAEVLTVKAESIECPFCRETNDAQVISCHACKAVLTLSDLELLLANQSADTMTLRHAVEEMERQRMSREFDSNELVTLGLGHLNLRNLQLGYSCLQEASRLSPNNVVLGGQVNSLLIRLEEIKQQEEAHLKMPKGKSILVVDDSPTVRKLISGKLEKCGHDVICANDGVEAMERLEHFVPDLVLLDITMPRMDGYQVCKQIRSNEATKDVTVVMISGKDGFFDKVRGRMAGTTGYITKPFGPETLMKAVEMYLSGEAPELDEV